ncbi:MAG: hypothetical protein U1F71_06960 [Verrucomicrobiaceae bacterium]
MKSLDAFHASPVNEIVQSRVALLLSTFLTAWVAGGVTALAIDPAIKPLIPAMLPPRIDEGVTRPRNASRTADALVLLPPPDGGEAVTVRRPVRQTPTSTDADPLAQLRRWQGAAAGMQPYTWGLSDADARLTLGVQSALYYTDNLYFLPRGSDKRQMMFEISPVIKVDFGDPQGWISGAGSTLSSYYGSLLYVPTFFYHLNDDVDDYAQHILAEVGRVNEVSRSALRFDYDQRKLASSENTSPEENYTMLDASGLTEYKITPLTTLRGKGTFRHITLGQNASGRVHWIGELWLVREISPKTKAGIGSEIGHILFDNRALGSQSYQQALFSFDWKPTLKVGFTTINGLEIREFTRAVPRDNMVSFVTNSALFWQATEKTRINLRLRVHNEPSALLQGSLYRSVRFGPDFFHDFSPNYYASFESTFIRRHYDTGRRDWEPMLRLAFGYRSDVDRQFNRTNVELFYQWHQRTRNDIQGANVTRSQVGVQLTHYF